MSICLSLEWLRYGASDSTISSPLMFQRYSLFFFIHFFFVPIQNRETGATHKITRTLNSNWMKNEWTTLTEPTTKRNEPRQSRKKNGNEANERRNKEDGKKICLICGFEYRNWINKFCRDGFDWKIFVYRFRLTCLLFCEKIIDDAIRRCVT